MASKDSDGDKLKVRSLGLPDSVSDKQVLLVTILFRCMDCGWSFSSIAAANHHHLRPALPVQSSTSKVPTSHPDKSHKYQTQ